MGVAQAGRGCEDEVPLSLRNAKAEGAGQVGQGSSGRARGAQQRGKTVEAGQWGRVLVRGQWGQAGDTAQQGRAVGQGSGAGLDRAPNTHPMGSMIGRQALAALTTLGTPISALALESTTQPTVIQ